LNKVWKLILPEK